MSWPAAGQVHCGHSVCHWRLALQPLRTTNPITTEALETLEPWHTPPTRPQGGEAEALPTLKDVHLLYE